MKTSRSSRRSHSEGQHQSLTAVGEEDRVVIIEWLNSAVGSESYRRVTRLIRNIQAADAAINAANRDEVYIHVGKVDDVPPEKVRRRRDLAKLFPPIASALKRYVFRPRLTRLLFGSQPWWFDLCGDSVKGDYRLTRAEGRRVYEADAVFGALRLASYGFVDRVRQCLTCQKWLYAHPAHKKFCDKKCQLKFFASTLQQKEKRAAYMRVYRRDQQERNKRAEQRSR